MLSASQNYRMVQTSINSTGNMLDVEREVAFASSCMKSVNWKGFEMKQPLPCEGTLRKSK
jgi:hypothetical protein